MARPALTPPIPHHLAPRPAALLDFTAERTARQARARIRQIALDQRTTNCIADTGHPQFPGWQALLLALACAAFIQAATGDGPFRIRSAPRTTRIVRVLRTGRP